MKRFVLNEGQKHREKKINKTTFKNKHRLLNERESSPTSQKLLCIKVTQDLHLIYSKNGGNLGLVLKIKNIACISIVLTKHVKYTYLCLFKSFYTVM